MFRRFRALIPVAMGVIAALAASCSTTPNRGPVDLPPPNTSAACGDFGPAGGTLAHASGVQLVIPAGALDATSNLCLVGIAAPTSTDLGLSPLGQGFEATPSGQTFHKPVEIALPFDATRLPAGATSSEVEVRMAPQGTKDFVSLTSTADLKAGFVRAQTVHFTQFVPAHNPNPVFITSPASSLPNGIVGSPYAASFAAVGGTAPYAWSLAAQSALPAGLDLNVDGALAGTPSVPSQFAFFVVAADSVNHSVQSAFSLLVSAPSNPVPTLTQIAPSTIAQGSPTTTLTLTGSSFAPTASVRWNGNPLATTFVSGTQVAAAVLASQLASAGTFAVTVVNPAPGGGTSNSIAVTVSGATPNPVPSIASVSPSTLPTAAIDTQITVTGSSFINASSVAIGAQGVPTSYVSPTQLRATIPASYLASAGTLQIGVYNPPPGGGFSAASVPLTVGTLNPVPTLSSLSPSSAKAGGTSFMLLAAGTGFVQGAQLFWNSIALSTTVTNDTSAAATIPASLIASAGSASVLIVNPTPGGGASGALAFNVTASVDAGVDAAIDSGASDAGGVVGWQSIYAGTWTSCALDTTGAAYCWGENTDGILGNGTAGGAPVVPTRAANGYRFDTLSLSSQICGIASGSLFCWGLNDDGQVGGSSPDQTVPLAIMPSAQFKKVAAGRTQTCAITTGGALSCWGASPYGALGATTNAIAGSYNDVSASQDLVCALDSNDVPHCWGTNAQGWGDITSHRLVTISAQWLSACGVGEDGLVYCWGDNSTCSLGLGASSSVERAPVQVTFPGNPQMVDVKNGCLASCALDVNGAVYCWGRNIHGALGLGATDSAAHTSAALVPNLPPMKSISMGNEWVCALSRAGDRWCWGWNQEGELGDGTTVTPKPTPEQLPFGVTMPDAGASDAATDASADTGGADATIDAGGDAGPQSVTCTSTDNLGCTPNTTVETNVTFSFVTYPQTPSGDPLGSIAGNSSGICRSVLGTPPCIFLWSRNGSHSTYYDGNGSPAGTLSNGVLTLNYIAAHGSTGPTCSLPLFEVQCSGSAPVH